MKLLVLLFLFSTHFAFSEDRVGNGGDVLICDEADGQSFYVLEEYEGMYDAKIGGEELSYNQKVEILLERIQKQFPERAKFYREVYGSFGKRMNFKNSPLPAINDSHEFPTPQCMIVQAAYFKRDSKNNYSYYIQKQIWDRLNNDQKAVLFFHEIMYTEAVGLGHSTSVQVRRANRLVFTSETFDGDFFDELFIQPLAAIKPTPKNVVEQLNSAYSDIIATYLMEQDLSAFYLNKTLKDALLVVRKRFNANSRVVKLVDKHLVRILQ